MRLPLKRPARAALLPLPEWASLHQTVAYMAFGTALSEDDWGVALYPGAARWKHPRDLLPPVEIWLRVGGPLTSIVRDALRALSIDLPHGRNLDCSLPDGSFHFDRSSVEMTALRKRMEGAIKWIAELQAPRVHVGDEPTLDEMHQAIWEASKRLHRQCAFGSLVVTGVPDHSRLLEEAEILERRIAPEEFQAGVLDWFGLNLVTNERLYVVSRDRPPSFRELAFRGEDILRLGPRSAVAPVADEDMRQPCKQRTRRGGRPPVHDWRAFDRQLVEIVALDGGNVTRTEIKRRMKEWAATNMDPTPDDRTIERRVDELVGPDVVPD